MKLSTIPFGFSSIEEYHKYIEECETSLYEGKGDHFLPYIAEYVPAWGVTRVAYEGKHTRKFSSPMFTLLSTHDGQDIDTGKCGRCQGQRWSMLDEAYMITNAYLVKPDKSDEELERIAASHYAIYTTPYAEIERFYEIYYKGTDDKWWMLKPIHYLPYFAAKKAHP